MKDLIKEKLLKEIKELKSKALDSEEKYALYCMRYFELKAKLQQHKETSKAKDEEFIKILEELQDLILKDGVYEIETEKHLAGLVDVKKVFNRFVEIKQRIKKNKE